MSTQPQAILSERLHGLDAVRGFALLLGIVLHASMSYLPGSQFFWVAHDGDASIVLSMAFYIPHMFRMLLFFLLAGFFGRMANEKLGAKRFVKDRFKRIVVPLLVGWPLALVSITIVLVWGAILANGGTLPTEAPSGPKFTPDDFPLTHLWFLYVLLLTYIAALTMRTASSRLPRLHGIVDKAVRVLAGPLGPLLLAVPLATALFQQSEWFAWFGIPTPDRSLYTNLAACTGFGSAFAFGWLLHRQRDLLRGWERRWSLHLSLAVLATIACLSIVGVAPLLQPATPNVETLAYAVCYAFAAWNWVFALAGLALRYLSGYSARRRYLADASYWMYLAHLPLVMALQVAASRIAAPVWLEVPALLAITVLVLLVSYHWLVRNSFIGAALNGKRIKHAIPGTALHPAAG